MNIRPEFILGKQKNNDWSGVYGYRPDEEMNPLELFAAMRLSSESEEVELERVANLLLDELQQSFFEKKETDTMQRLENAMWKMKSRMEMILSREDKIVESGIDIEIAVVVIENQFLYAAIVGESKIFIQRDDNFADISNGLIDRNMMGFLRSGSLKLEHNDRICICTSRGLEDSNIQSALKELDLKYLEDTQNIYGSAALILADESLDWKSNTAILEPEVIDDNKQMETDTPEQLTSEEKMKIVPSNLDHEEIPEEIQSSDNNMGDEFREDMTQDYPEIDETPKVTLMQKAKTGFGNLRSGITQRIDNFKQRRELNKVRANDYQTSDSSPVKSLRSTGQVSENMDRDTELDENEYYYRPDYEVTKDRDQGNLFDKIKVIIAGLILSIKGFWQNRMSKLFKDNNRTYAKVLRDIGNVISKFFANIWQLFRREVIGTGDRRDAYLKASRRKRNRILLAVFVVVLGVIVFNAYSTRQAQIREQEKMDTIRKKVQIIQTQMDNLKIQVASNQSADDEEKSALVTQLDKIYTDAETQKKDNLFLDELNKVQEDSQKSKDGLLSIFGFTELQIISDLGKIYADANLSDIVYTSGNLYVSDQARNVVYQIAPNLNSQPTTFASGLNKPTLLVRNAAGDIIFYDDDASSIIGKISIKESGKVTRFSGLAAGVVGKISAADIFGANDFLYELHQHSQQIFRRAKDGSTYVSGGGVFVTTNPPNWKSDPEFANAIDIAVPREIYVLIDGKGMRRYLSGGDNSITSQTYKGLLSKDVDAIANATSFDIAGTNLVIADPLNKRVLLFTLNNDGTIGFQKQYVYRGSDANAFKNIKEVVINETAKNIYVLDGSKIVRLDL